MGTKSSCLLLSPRPVLSHPEGFTSCSLGMASSLIYIAEPAATRMKLILCCLYHRQQGFTAQQQKGCCRLNQRCLFHRKSIGFLLNPGNEQAEPQSTRIYRKRNDGFPQISPIYLSPLLPLEGDRFTSLASGEDAALQVWGSGCCRDAGNQRKMLHWANW